MGEIYGIAQNNKIGPKTLMLIVVDDNKFVSRTDNVTVVDLS